MCGIAAVVGLPVDPERGDASLGALAHRGPDAQGSMHCVTGEAWLGHRRLAIVDLSDAGNQPMANEDRSVHLVCNGEIYNAPALRRELERHGHRFASRSDNEVILHAYEEWGDGCVERIEGMFAFALWDRPRRRLLAARDRVGIKPLYFAQRRRGMALASEISGLLPLLGELPETSPLAVAYVMTLGYVPAPLTIRTGVEKLEPGHLLIWSNGRLERRRYWQPPEAVVDSPGSDSREWDELWPEVLRDHLLADVPLGLLLSGGLDSSSVAVGLAEIGAPLQTLTIGFPGSPKDEAPVAARVAEHLGLPSETWSMEGSMLDDLMVEAWAEMDEPQGGSGPLSMRLLCRHASARFKVVLGGDGGDEVFGGYGWYAPRSGQEITRRARSLRRLLRPVVMRIPTRRIWRLATHAFIGTSPLHRHAGRKYLRFLPEEVEHLLRPSGQSFDDDRMLEPLARHWRPSMPIRRALQRVDLMTYCSDLVLAKTDRASMAFGLEVRVPMLDRRVIEWGLRRPMAPGEERELKPVLRRYLASRLPEDVLRHPKQGFHVPIVKSKDHTAAIRRIAEGPLVSDGMLAPDWAKFVAPGTLRRKARIWCLLAVSEWLRLQKERAPAAAR